MPKLKYEPKAKPKAEPEWSGVEWSRNDSSRVKSSRVERMEWREVLMLVLMLVLMKRQ